MEGSREFPTRPIIHVDSKISAGISHRRVGIVDHRYNTILQCIVESNTVTVVDHCGIPPEQLNSRKHGISTVPHRAFPTVPFTSCLP